VPYNKALDLQPDNSQIYYNRGLVFASQNRNEDAIKSFSKAIELKNDYSGAYYNRGKAEYNLGKKDIACNDLKQAARLGFQVTAEDFVRLCN
jgi:tetratricopeptide (TPR) repeat protein